MKKVDPEFLILKDSRNVQEKWKAADLVRLPKWVLEPTDAKKGGSFCQGINEMLNGTKGELR